MTSRTSATGGRKRRDEVIVSRFMAGEHYALICYDYGIGTSDLLLILQSAYANPKPKLRKGRGR